MGSKPRVPATLSTVIPLETRRKMNKKINGIKIVKSDEPIQVGTLCCAGIIVQPDEGRSPVGYIEKYLIKEVGEIVKNHQELSWVLMTAGIEFLGRCLDTDNADIVHWYVGYGEKVFKNAIANLFPSQYHQHNDSSSDYYLYKQLRCGFNHTTLPGNKIILSEGVLNQKHLSLNNGYLILVAEDFYDDFKKACEQVVDKLKNEKIKPKFYLKTIR